MDEEQVQGDSSEENLTVIWAEGNILLTVHDESLGQNFSFRVGKEQLEQASPYFKNLLDPSKFGEGVHVSEKLELLQKKYGNSADIPTAELPQVKIADIGKISHVNTIKPLISDFLSVLHGLELSMVHPPIPNLANLAVVADRFAALPTLMRHLQRKKIFTIIDARAKRASTGISEERARQKLLIGLLLDHPVWVSEFSKRLILSGSTRWKIDAVKDTEAALWWDLPLGIEEEMLLRRDYILDTIQSIQDQFLKLYSARERQCRLGYDSSPQCDSFQLGEMVRFFTRINTLRLEGSLCIGEEAEPFYGGIERLLELLRQCTSYQIDKNHSHCGLRTRLMPLLNQLEPFLLVGNMVDVGICGACWQAHRRRYAWSEAKRPVLWRSPVVSSTSGRAIGVAGSEACLAFHLKVRDMFTATTKDWLAADTVSGPGGRFGGPSTPSLRYD
ncbi:hypothetical protein EJ08DRAFT_421357 [Tothia fuscella]|uniref:BTB domain-containing protein n=1 Tax=Tothia fuscella TaxID=1048955 RepID=A0A9P4TVC8_9PEZI|nr:hypothetical protein EJ08DRAFT_421357 [Tothia fuscella]